MPVAQFRNPLTFDYAQTYPLPPPSTVIGMIQSQLGEFGLGPKLHVSVKGFHEAVAFNYVRMVKGQLLLTDIGMINVYRMHKKTHQEPLLKSTRSPTYQQELHRLELVLHLRGDPRLLERIHSALAAPRRAVVLGRGEDVAFLKEEPRIVNIGCHKPRRKIQLEYDSYVPDPEDASYLPRSPGANPHTKYLMLYPNYELRGNGYAYSVYVQGGGFPKTGIRCAKHLMYVKRGEHVEFEEDACLDFVEGLMDPLFWLPGDCIEDQGNRDIRQEQTQAEARGGRALAPAR
jgi:CRISPR-associated Cas5-like protein